MKRNSYLFLLLLFACIYSCKKENQDPINISTSWQRISNDNFVPPTNSVYIDPGAKINGTGTLESPFNGSTFQVQYGQPWKSSLTYLFKRGTVFEAKYQLRITANNITIGAYGTGARPVIRASFKEDKIIDLGGIKDGVIRDVEIYSPDNSNIDVYVMNNIRGAVINCKIHGGEWGIHVINSSGLFRVINCEVSNTGDDGCFFSDLDSLEFAGTHVYAVNQKYFVNHDQTYSGGDCLQVHNILNFSVHDNILDHSGTGNKFCFIAVNDTDKNPATGIIERNLFERDKSNNLIYLFSTVENTIIRFNKFVNGDIAIYNHSNNPQVYYNEFVNISKDAYLGLNPNTNTRILNNTFDNINTLVSSYTENILFENNIVYLDYGKVFEGRTNIDADYNCYHKITDFGIDKTGNNSTNADPLFKSLSLFDFELNSESPCIDKGFYFSDMKNDIYGISVPCRVKPDMGAHEFNSAQ